MTQRIAVAFVLLVTSFAAFATQAGVETRTHYEIVDKNLLPLFYATVIRTESESLDAETYLIADTSGQRVRIDIRHNYKEHMTTAEYSVNDGPPAKVTLFMPYSSTTRSGLIEEGRTRKELLAADVPITIEAHGRSLETSEKEWDHAVDKAALHEKAKDLVGADLAAVLTNLRWVLAFPDFLSACSTLSFVTGGDSCVGRTDRRIAVTRPDCDFDAKFGAPCDAAQKSRAKAQPKNGRVGPY